MSEINRVESALNKTQSVHLRKDYTKYLRRLRRELSFYDGCMRDYEKRRMEKQNQEGLC